MINIFDFINHREVNQPIIDFSGEGKKCLKCRRVTDAMCRPTDRPSFNNIFKQRIKYLTARLLRFVQKNVRYISVVKPIDIPFIVIKPISLFFFSFQNLNKCTRQRRESISPPTHKRKTCTPLRNRSVSLICNTSLYEFYCAYMWKSIIIEPLGK